MKHIFIFFCFCNVAFSWEIKERAGQTFLLDPQYNINEKVLAMPDVGIKRETIIKELDSDLTLITYLVNVGGTKEVTRTFNCSLYSKKLKKLIFKDNLCKSVSSNKNKLSGPPETVEASFVIRPNEIIYQYEELIEKY